MATFPQGMTQVDRRCNAGERRVLQALKRCLDDDYLVWHDVPIGPRQRQPDFVILSPRRGMLLLEVKDWRLPTIHRASPRDVMLRTERGEVTVPHPLAQARVYALELVDLMQADPLLVCADGAHQGRLLFPWGWGVALSHLRRAEVAGSDFEAVFAPERTLLRDDLDESVERGDFEQRLWSMFTVQFPYTLTLPQRDRVRWHLFPELRVESRQQSLELRAASPALVLPDLLQVMDLQQEQIARTLGGGHRVIHGVAGSGKTMILVFRAEQLAAATRADMPILVLCYNRELAARLDALLRARGVDERVVVRTFHGWCEDLVRSYQLVVGVPRKAPDYFERLADAVCRAVERKLVPAGQYTALLIDEAHDFEDAWLRLAAQMVDPATQSLLVLYDDAQSIYQRRQRRSSFASLGIEAVGRSTVLKINYRNTAEVLALAMQVAQGLLQGDAADEDEERRILPPSSAGRRGPLPLLLQARSAAEEAALVAERITQALAAGASLGDVAILCRAKHLMAPFERALAAQGVAFQSMRSQTHRRFDWAVPAVKLATLHSAKGLEFPLVFVAGLQVLPDKHALPDEEIRLLYVAMTRATRELVLSASGDSPVVARVRQALETVRRQFDEAEAAGR